MPEHIISNQGLVAWRQLDIAENTPLLCSGNAFIWKPRAYQTFTTKRCGYKNVVHPSTQCTCGIYSFKEQEEVLRPGSLNPNAMHALVRLGVFGRVLRYTGGYRSEHAQILEIIIVYPTEEQEDEALSLMFQLQEVYGVPVDMRLVPKGDPVYSGRFNPGPVMGAAPTRKTLSFGNLVAMRRRKADLEPDDYMILLTELRKRMYTKIPNHRKAVENLAAALRKKSQELDAMEDLMAQVQGEIKAARTRVGSKI
jgi:hypothetical protein